MIAPVTRSRGAGGCRSSWSSSWPSAPVSPPACSDGAASAASGGAASRPRSSRSATRRPRLGTAPDCRRTFPLANQTFTLSNLGDEPVRAAVTVHPDGGADPVAHNRERPGRLGLAPLNARAFRTGRSSSSRSLRRRWCPPGSRATTGSPRFPARTPPAAIGTSPAGRRCGASRNGSVLQNPFAAEPGST